MIVDASGIVLDEPDARRLARRLDEAPHASTHPVTVYEAVLAVARASRRSLAEAEDDVRHVLAEASVSLIGLGQAEANAALAAFAR